MNIVSSCLIGVSCRFDAKHKKIQWLCDIVAQGEAIPVCPEQLGGLPTPRPTSERVGNKVVTQSGNDVTSNFHTGASEAIQIALMSKSKHAYLKSKSPMCGCGKIYDGSFSGKLVDGDGVFTELLKQHGIEVTPVD